MVPLHVAAEAGRYKIVGFLFGAEVGINMKDDKGVGILDYTTNGHLISVWVGFKSGLFIIPLFC